MLPQMTKEFVEKYKWIEKDEIVDLFAVAQTLPGVIAINACVLIGYKLGKVPMAIVAALGVILPSFIVLIFVALSYDWLLQSTVWQGAMRGIRACVVGLLLNTAIKLRKSSLNSPITWIIAAASIFICLFTQINLIWLIIAGGIIGLICQLFKNRKELNK